MLDIRPFKHFLAVVRAGSFYRAAQELHLSPPALTKSIKNLEEDLGVQLFDRQYGCATPTPYGRVLGKQAQRLLNDLDSIKATLIQMVDLEAGELAIGAGPASANGIVARAITRLSNEYPRLKIRLHVENVDGLTELLRVGKIELIVGVHEELAGDPGLEIEPLFEEPFRPVCRAGHPLQSSQPVTLKQLQAYPWACTVIPRKQIAQVIERFGVETAEKQFTFQSDDYGVIFKLVRGSNYIAFLTDAIAEEEVEAGRLAFLTTKIDIGSNRPGLIRLARHTLSPSAEVFCRLLRESRID